MLVQRRTAQTQIIPAQDRAGIGHRLGKGNALVAAHATKEHRHGEGRDLAFAEAAIGDAADHELQLGVSEGAAVAFLADEFLGEQH